MPRYGTVNVEYVMSWMSREHDEPMWALNLMKYREKADYEDGRQTTLTGEEADDLYAPHGPLASVGGKIVLMAPVVTQLVGDATMWDRIAIALYPKRRAFVDMQRDESFQELHAHKEAGMEFTIVLGTFPEQVSATTNGSEGKELLLLQVVAEGTPDIADGIDATRIGTFRVEDVIIGDERRFAEVRWDLISTDTADALAAKPQRTDESSYVVVARPDVDLLAESLAMTRT